MKTTAILSMSLRIIASSVVYALCFLLAMNIAMRDLQLPQLPAEEAAIAAGALPLVALLNSAVLALVILRSRWSGWKLSAAVFIIFFGTFTFLAQIESLAFLSVRNLLPAGMVPALFAAGAILAALFSPLAVFVLGKWRTAPPTEPNLRLCMPVREWLWKMAMIAVVYELLYFTFGYFIAWRNPAVQAYYGGVDPGNFFLQMANVLRETSWLPFFQVLRASLWVLIALPVVRMLKGQPWETALILGLCFAVLMNAQHLFPNPYMPREVSMAHLIETATSNFIFGIVVGLLLLWRPQTARQHPSTLVPTA
jgi:hypothetical protein